MAATPQGKNYFKPKDANIESAMRKLGQIMNKIKKSTAIIAEQGAARDKRARRFCEVHHCCQYHR